jgi:hypothetical protein
MELRGRLLYVSHSGETLNCHYVLYPIAFWDTDLLELIRSVCSLPEWWIERILNNVSDVFTTIQEVREASDIPQILSHIPEHIESGVPLLRSDYLQLQGAEQFWNAPMDYVLCDIAGKFFVNLAVLTGLTELETYLVTGVTVTYKRFLKPTDRTSTPVNYVRIPVYGGKYDLVCPAIDWYDTIKVYERLVVARKLNTGWPLYHIYTSLLLSYANLFAGPPPDHCPGHYFCSDSEIQFTPGISEGGLRVNPGLSDDGLDACSPFSATHPADAVLQGANLHREFESNEYRIVRGQESTYRANYKGGGGGGGGGEIKIEPTEETIEENQRPVKPPDLLPCLLAMIFLLKEQR